ncbi:MAG TPA: hypothetical protein VGS07_28985 [Thermoanaerobaculia bacterium]|jgi:hypothetical protein|nr:hypothetical protein [Thermoanaerobaculia bacterium]
MTKLLRLLAVLLFVFAARPAAATLCNNGPMVTCFDYLPQYQTADPSWRYSHQCCDLHNHTTVWYVYIDSADNWYLVGTDIPP